MVYVSWWLCVVPRKFLGIVGQDSSDSKSSRLHVDNLMVLLYSFEVHSMDSSITIGTYLEVSNFNRFFLKLNQFICN
jgi:type III secretory pathway component EscR